MEKPGSRILLYTGPLSRRCLILNFDLCKISSHALALYFLCKVFMNNCHNTHLEKMLKMVSSRLEEREFGERKSYKQCMEWRVGYLIFEQHTKFFSIFNKFKLFS